MIVSSNFPAPQELLFHRAPMVLLDRVEAADAQHVVCGLAIRHDSAFVENGRVPALVALEYMAQSVGVFAGLERLGRSQSPCMGFLVGVRDLELACDAFVVGQALRVEARWVWGGERVGQFDCTVCEAGGESLASATLSVFVPGDAATQAPARAVQPGGHGTGRGDDRG